MESINFTFEQILNHFTSAVLGIYKANYLLNEENVGILSTDEIAEIERELYYSKTMADRLFGMLQDKGIPPGLISSHLQVKI